MWKRSDAIPMGGSFSAQCAELHSLWALKQVVEIMRRFGTLIEQEPFPVWETPAGNTVSLSQFRDNVNVSAKGPSASNEMSRVCDAVSQCWNLPPQRLLWYKNCEASCNSLTVILGLILLIPPRAPRSQHPSRAPC